MRTGRRARFSTASRKSEVDTVNSVLYRSIDRWVQRLQWPTAGLAVIWLPFLIWAVLGLSRRVLTAPLATLIFCSGIAVFVLVWRFLLRFQTIGPWLMRAEHEATHLLFALMTAHPIVGLSREERQGSYVRFLGSGNWLIQIAPYFFPTAAVFLWFIALLIPFGSFLPWTNIALGMATGFHVVSTIREIRRDQEELRSLSWRFCWMFLPTANLLMLGLLVAFSHNGFAGLYDFIGDMFQPIHQLWRFGLGWSGRNDDRVSSDFTVIG